MKEDRLLDQLESVFRLISPEQNENKEIKGKPSAKRVANPDKTLKKVPSETRNRIDAKISEVRKMFNRAPLLSKYKLSNQDIKIVSFLYPRINNELKFEADTSELLLISGLNTRSLLKKKDYLVSLLEREIVTLSHYSDGNYYYKQELLLDGQYGLNSYFFHSLNGKDIFKEASLFFQHRINGRESTVYIIGEFLDYLFQHYDETTSYIKHDNGQCYGRTVVPYLAELKNRLTDSSREDTIAMSLKKGDIETFDFYLIAVIYYLTAYRKENLTVNKLLRMVSNDENDFKCKQRLFNSETKTKLSKYLEDDSNYRYFSDDIALSEEFLHTLTSSPKIDVDKYLKNSEYFEIVETKQTLEHIILPGKEYELLSGIVSRMKNSGAKELSGLLSPSLAAGNEAANACNIIFYGCPGTGKTLAAGVIANELKRSLIAVNLHSLRGCYYGTTEKRVREMFRVMRQIIANSISSPVFLLNEADQLIHKRITGSSSVDYTENSIQSIFLEELETMPGIIIATTNLIANLDTAMSRRFHFKIEFTLPDEQCRYKLWELHLPKTIPGVDDIDISYLAKRYTFSGGQIRIVVENSCYSVLSRGKESKLSTTDIIHFAELEANSNFDTVTRKIGFLG